MAYVEGRVVHDADSHIMETSEMLADFASEKVKRHLLGFDGSASVATSLKELERVLARHRDPAYRADDEREILLRKNWAATGAFFKEDRPRALDLLGFASQLVFNTFVNGYSSRLERTSDDLDSGLRLRARAQPRHARLLRRRSPAARDRVRAAAPTSRRARAIARAAIADGCAALLVPSGCPRGHSPSHTGLFPVWAQRGGGGHTGRVPRRRRRCDSCSTRTTSTTAARAARLPRRRRELPLGRLHGDSDRRRCRRSRR